MQPHQEHRSRGAKNYPKGTRLRRPWLPALLPLACLACLAHTATAAEWSVPADLRASVDALTDAQRAFIESGEMLASKNTPQGAVVVGTVEAGHVIGEVTVVAGGLRTATLTASGPVEVLEIERADFEDWLEETCTRPDLTKEQRRGRLIDWAAAPHARYCHPREEHLLPLHVCYGAAGSAAARALRLRVLGKQTSAFLW